MPIGTLVIHENDDYEGMGIVVDEYNKDGYEYTMVTVQWLDGMGVGLYWADELEVVCK